MVIPAIIPTSRYHLDQMLTQFALFTDMVHVDIVDGIFAPRASWPYADAQNGGIANLLGSVTFNQCAVELDLMITAPETTLDDWCKTDAARIVVHVESTEKLPEILEHAGEHTYGLGLAFNNDTDFSLLNNIDLTNVGYLQLMGIREIGSQGQPFDERVLERIAFVKKTYPALTVSVDGSVNAQTIPLLMKAGADRFTVGSAITRAENPTRAYNELVTFLDPIKHTLNPTWS